MSELGIPPPAPLPELSGPEPSPEPPEKKESLFPRLKKWSGVAGAVVALFSLLGGVWKTVAYINDLHDTIGSNKEAQVSNAQAHEEIKEQIRTVAVAVRTQRDHDQEVITNLRIAVAALQAAQGVRAGRLTYGGVQDNQIAMAEAPRPTSARVRREQAARAEEDAQAAIERAMMAQETADEEDPLAALEGL